MSAPMSTALLAIRLSFQLEASGSAERWCIEEIALHKMHAPDDMDSTRPSNAAGVLGCFARCRWLCEGGQPHRVCPAGVVCKGGGAGGPPAAGPPDRPGLPFLL